MGKGGSIRRGGGGGFLAGESMDSANKTWFNKSNISGSPGISGRTRNGF
jgi:hypothetical protein